jgi:SAM-dependent methyltransferase
MATAGHRFSKPASDAEFVDPLTTIDPLGWYGGSIRAWKVLCLAAGGGRQGPLYAAAGAQVWVVDISAEQLAIDRAVAADRGLELTTVQTSMDELSMFATAQFDLVIQPVSTCYIPSLASMFHGLARVVRPDGLYVSQHKTPQNLQTTLTPGAHGKYEIDRPYYANHPSVGHAPNRLREAGTAEYVHTFEAILGGMCSVGFVVERFVEPFHAVADGPVGSFGHRCYFVPPYVRIQARRAGPAAVARRTSPIVEL